MNLPDWMNLLLTRPGDSVTSPFEQALAMRTREMSLPPDMRMSGVKRELRDAFLARKLLQVGNPWQTLAAGLQHEAARCLLNERIAELTEFMAEADIQRCEEVARVLFSWRLAAARNGR